MLRLQTCALSGSTSWYFWRKLRARKRMWKWESGRCLRKGAHIAAMTISGRVHAYSTEVTTFRVNT
ncbi:hypothetical protein L914_04566 [Phytophthora nicotianae]|uniref:Uncharacterized protein n=1 Tax=Phytophthora nicotianae TaxID=4792 RepID=W2NVF9_PHYNI|nr:hypothetical protein L914_04566 [Phytophthora nicotianae]